MAKRAIWICMVAMMMGLAYSAVAQQQANSTGSSKGTVTGDGASVASGGAGTAADPPQSAKESTEERAMRLEGEKRFRTNCGRCHQPPHKFPPRVMAAAIRHMRVRAMITDEDMKLILRYMTQ